MKTLLKVLSLVIALTSTCLAQQLQDFDKAKVRMRITVKLFTLKGVVCSAGLLERNKLGKEVLVSGGMSADPFAAGGGTEIFSGAGSEADPFAASASGSCITIIDLASQPIKPGETRDLTLYPVDPLSQGNKLYAYNMTNALLATQGKFVQTVTLALVEKMGFDATLSKGSDGKIYARGGMLQNDAFGSGAIINLIGAPRAAKTKLYPTVKTDTYALTAQDAFKTWQAKP